MLAEQCGDAIRVVLLGILLAAGPEVSEVEQVQCEREHPVAIEAATTKIGSDAPAHVGQRGRHLQHSVELLLVALLLPLLVIEVLAAARGIGSDRLDVPVRVRAIQTFFHAGGITRSLMRCRVAASVIGVPSGFW